MCNIAFKKRPILWFLCGAFALVFAWSAYAPVSREDWWMENVLVLTVIAVAIVGYPHVRLSDLSYFFICCFLCLHEVGAHYTYDYVPLGYWLKDTFHFRRNDYDRIVHFSFGFFWAYPAREMFLQAVRTRKFWTYFSPVGIILAVSALFEIIEAYMAQLYPGMEEKYVGMQGDIFDSQRDMTCAILGAVICMVLTAIAQFEGRLADSPEVTRIESARNKSGNHNIESIDRGKRGPLTGS